MGTMNEEQNAVTPDPEETLPEPPPNLSAELAEEEGEEVQFQLQENLTPLVNADDMHQLLPDATHPLPNLQDRLIRNTRQLTFSHARDIGLVRASNEDATLAFHSGQQNVQDNPDFSVFIVADGAGGHADGEFASSVAARTLLEHVSKEIYLPMLLNQIDPAEAEPVPPITEVLVDGYKAADHEVRTEVPGGGTTLTTVTIIGDLAHIAHVGDSRAYLITKEDDEPEITQLTRDHSVARRLQEIGQITATEVANHPEASRLWKIMGLSENLEPDINTRRLPENSYLVMCSDGLWNMVPDEAILKTVVEAPNPQEATSHLIAAANASGGTDNIAVIVVHMP